MPVGALVGEGHFGRAAENQGCHCVKRSSLGCDLLIESQSLDLSSGVNAHGNVCGAILIWNIGNLVFVTSWVKCGAESGGARTVLEVAIVIVAQIDPGHDG